MKTVLGIDYACVKGYTLDANKVKRTGTEFAILRATYGLTKDPLLARDFALYEKAGIKRGAYMFPVMHWTREPEPQVAAFKAAVDAGGGLRPGVDLPPVLDVEFPKGVAATGLTRLQCIDWVERAVDALTKTFGCLPILYTSARVWDGEDLDSLDADKVPVPRLADCPLWIARYPYKLRIPVHYRPEERDGLKVPPVPKQLGDADDVWIHQYQGDGTGFPGISRTVDLNRFFPGVRGATGIERTKWIQRKIAAFSNGICGVGAIDGLWGNQTERALREFQSLHRLYGSGVVDLNTFCKLAWL